MIEERRYDKAGVEQASGSGAAASSGAIRDGIASISTADALDAFEDASAPSLQPGFGSSYVSEEVDSDNPYAWAQRLRSIPDKASGPGCVLGLVGVLLWMRLRIMPSGASPA
jgi:hypothetical protein